MAYDRRPSVDDLILEQIRDVKIHLGKQDEKLDRIEKQTTITNGRVLTLENARKETEPVIWDLKKKEEQRSVREKDVGAAAREHKENGRFWTSMFFKTILPWATTAVLGILTILTSIGVIKPFG